MPKRIANDIGHGFYGIRVVTEAETDTGETVSDWHRDVDDRRHEFELMDSAVRYLENRTTHRWQYCYIAKIGNDGEPIPL